MEPTPAFPTEVYRPRTGQVLTVSIAVLAALGVVAAATTLGVAQAARTAPVALLVAGTCWALFWHPHVEVGPATITVVNVLRTVVVPWPAVREVDTRWGLTLQTPWGRVRAWAAPAPGAAHIARVSVRTEGRHLPRSTYVAAGLRPADLPTSPSGQAALLVRQRWEQLQRAGVLDHARLEHDSLPMRWHGRLMALGAVLVTASAAGLWW